MNNSLEPGPSWNGRQSPNHQTLLSRQLDPRLIATSHGTGNQNSAGLNLGSGHGTMPNSGSSIPNHNPTMSMNMNPGLGTVNPKFGAGMTLNTGGPSSNPTSANMAGYGMNPNMLQRTMPLNMQSGPNTQQQMNGYPPSSMSAAMSTPSSVGGRFPMWDMDIPSQMFMQAVNFEQLMGKQSGGMADMSFGSSAPGNVMNSTRLSEDSHHKSEAGLDLLEQQQAVEQARLLQRFKELRHWQQQQQEMLMSQQHQQLSMLRQEQQRVQTIITKQREQQWGGGKTNNRSNTATPPKFQLPPGMDISKLMANGMIPSAQQARLQPDGGLPKPVIYVDPKDDDDEIKTNPDLFSDTNSNRGSQAGLDEGIYPIPDSASEASVDVRQGSLPFQQQPKLYQPRFNKRVTESPRISHHHSVLDADSDDGHGSQSFQSPTLPASKPPATTAGSQGESEEESSEEGDNSEDDSDQGEEASDNEDDEFEDIDEEDEDEEQQTTQIEVHKDGLNFDEIPIKTAIEGPKSFEELLEEQLKAEEERLRKAAEAQDSPSHPKRKFLKKGEGLARFDVKPGQRPSKPKKPTLKSTGSKSSLGTQKTSAGGASESHKTVSQTKGSSNAGSKSDYQSKSKANQSVKSGSQPASKKSTMSVGEKQVAGDHTKSSQSDKPIKPTDNKNKKSLQKSPSHGNHQSSQGETVGNQKELSKKSSVPLKKIRAPESIPDDTSFIASLKERQKESEIDLAELDEFEILEEMADNMSFCSNSSIVTKGIHGLQSDRILTGLLPKGSSHGKPNTKPSMLVEQRPNTEHIQQHQAVVKPFSVNTELRNTKAEIQTHQPGNDKPDNESTSSSDDDDDDDDDSSSDDDSDSQTDSGDDEVNEQTNRSSNIIRNKDNLRLTHNQFSQVSGKGLVSKNDEDEDRKEKKASAHSFDKERKMLTFSDSEYNESETEETETKYSEYELQEVHSPSKIMTRKVAVRDDRKTGVDTRTLLQKVTCNPVSSGSGLLPDLDSSAFAPRAKSPLVISKEKVVTSKPLPAKPYLHEDKFIYHSDSDSNGNKLKASLSDDESSDTSVDEVKTKAKVFNERKTLQFDDDDEWEEKTPSVSRTRENRRSSGNDDHDRTLVDESEKKNQNIPALASEKISEDASTTPPTSKLVSKLFPKLKPQQEKQQQEDQSIIQTASQAIVGDGVQSKALRDKLIELEREIEKFRNENSHLAKLRSEREEGLTKLKREIGEFEKEKTDELKRLEEFKKEEMKKLKHERKMFDKYQKASRACPDKKEREEIEMLKTQLTELQEEMKRKESRWSANNSRLRSKVEQLEQENEELKEEIKIMEKKRLEWLQKEQNKAKSSAQVPVRSSTPTAEEEMMANHLANSRLAANFGQDQFNDLSTASSIKSNVSLKPSQGQPKVNVRSSFPPQSKGQASANVAASHSKTVNNSNQSAKSHIGSTKVNQSKTVASHNSKLHSQGHQGHAHSLNQKKPPAKQGPRSQDSLKPASQTDKNILRNSLTEDLPRRELITTAAPQDVSMYSETDGETSIQAPANIPRKLATASRLGVDKSIIDKGDNDFEETQHSDGKVERVYSNGAREILFSNGTRKEISSDGQSIVVSFFNGDIKQIMADQRVIYYYADAQTTHINYPDGLEILQFPNHQIEKLYPDGTKEITFTDQTIKYVFPNGSEESIFQDGTVIRLDKNGDKTMEFPNGQREIHTQEYKKREYPDGTVKTVYPDGRQETRYSNGRLRVKDKDGNIIIDRHY